jgi:ribosome assembly protein 1
LLGFSILRQLTLEEIERRREDLRKLKKEIESGERCLDSLSLDVKADGKDSNVNEENQFVFLAFARVLSGTIRKGQQLFIQSPKHNPSSFVGKVSCLMEIMSISEQAKN